MQALRNPVLVGVIGAAQGIRGEVRVRSYTEDPMAIGEYGALLSADGRRFEILDIRPAKTVVVMRLRGVNDRNAAEALKGVELFVDRSSLRYEDLGEDEYFQADLEGLEALDSEGKSWGVISAVLDFGGGDLLELKPPGRRSVLIPFTVAAVPKVNIANGTILIDPAAAGLLDDGSSESDEEDDEGHGKGGR